MYKALIAILVVIILYLLYANYWVRPSPPPVAPLPPPAPVVAPVTPQVVVVDTSAVPVMPLTTYSSWYEGNYPPWGWHYGRRWGYGPRPFGGWRRRR
jgi:hypothetical protein